MCGSKFVTIDLHGRRAIVSGGGSGIGRTIAEGLADRGASVIVGDKLESAKFEHGEFAMMVDYADEQQTADFMARALSRLGGLDILVNNVGIAGPSQPIDELDLQGLRTTFAVNVESHAHMTRLAAKALRRSGVGCIVNIGSVAGRMGVPNRIPYVVSKWGIIGLSKTLAMEFGASHVRVNAILPGLVTGPRLKRVQRARAQEAGSTLEEQVARELAGVSLGRFVRAEDVANLALFLASDFATNISGQAICVDGDLHFGS